MWLLLRKRLSVRHWKISESYKEPSTRELAHDCGVAAQGPLALSVVRNRWCLPRNRRLEWLAQKGIALEPTQTFFLILVLLPLQECVPHSLQRIEPVRALRNYELFHQLPKGCSVIEQVIGSSPGIQGFLDCESDTLVRIGKMYSPTSAAACGPGKPSARLQIFPSGRESC